jgi:hypothetical protein
MGLLVPTLIFAIVSALPSLLLMAVVHALPDSHIAVVVAICALVIAISVVIGSAL